MFHITPMFVRRKFSGSAFDFGYSNGAEIPLIHANVHGVARTLPLIMDVAEELKRPAAGMVPCDHRIVAKCVGHPAPILDLDHVPDCIPRQLQRRGKIVITDDKVLARPWQLKENALDISAILRSFTEGKVTQDP
ncbi:hypothetical protein GLS40_17540 [Pseudooceanicola sp. 216_PA32_1]|uniref:Uncharacterized protein n=1 Tax=Pseudooceanicola pacificus TaxID=2676438 RepID=A0A844W694_9RHOB|nr:hypothetical protein [Pseudooceanicola pacificus]MWB79836.1 hypothetical protein [Pseudooceanicola pacificus]